jgi:Putative lumazine-binding
MTVILAASSAAFTQASEEDAVRVPLNNYIKGHETGDGEYMKKAFHTEGNLIFIRDGKYTTRSFTEYIAGFTKPGVAPDESKRKRTIEKIDISGNAANAKIVLDYPNVRFVDYMSLLKINGEWKIVNKIFYAEPKSKPAGE